MELKVLLFDVDGTLADTERQGHRVAFNAAFVETGLDWQWDESLYGELLQVTGGKERIAFYLDRFHISCPVPERREDFIAQLHRCKTRYFKALLDSGRIPLRLGVSRLLAEAHRSGVRLAIATTTSAENVVSLLDRGGGEALSTWFEVIAAGDMVTAKKPAPDIYLLAMEKLGVEPADCVAIEDSRNGLLAALGAGIRTTVVTVNSYTRNEDFTGARLVIDHLGDPGSPFRCISGEAQGHLQVDMALLRALHNT